jgi:hypothetical protein
MGIEIGMGNGIGKKRRIRRGIGRENRFGTGNGMA